MSRSYKPEVLSEDTGKWYGANIRFVNWRGAEEFLVDLEAQLVSLGASIRTSRLVTTNDPPTHQLVNGVPERLI